MTSAARPFLANDPFAERCVFWYFALTPLWWMTGTLLLLGLVGTVFLFLRQWPQEPRAMALFGFWVAVWVAQGVSTVFNWSRPGEAPFNLLRVLFSLANIYWFILGMSLAVGCQGALTGPRIIRAACIQALWILIFSIISLIAAHVLDMDQLLVPSPLALLLPGDLQIVYDHLTMKFYKMDELMGGEALRLTLFFPWPTALSLGGATAMLVGMRDENIWWRAAALLGGGMGVVFGYSRTVAACLVVCFAIIAFFRLPARLRLGGIAAGALAFNVLLLTGFDPVESFTKLNEDFTQVRPGSSLARYIIYDQTWRRFVDSPLLGYGYGDGIPIAKRLPSPIASHSTFYATLYLGGIFTFVVLCVSSVATTVMALLRLGDRTQDAAVALALLIMLVVVSYGENINFLVPSLLLTFFWVGGVMRPPAPAERPLVYPRAQPAAAE